MRVNKSKKAQLRRILRLTSSLFLMMIFTLILPKHAMAATGISVKEINYENSTITLQLNSGDTEAYFSDSNKKNWETIPGKLSSNNTVTMDISWIPVTKNYVMTFKGNSSTSVTSVIIPKQITNFKATYNKVKGQMSFSNTGSRTIQWRKKGSTTWNTVNTSTISTEMNYFCTNGATVYFRLAPINGNSSSSGSRPSKEVTINIPKKASAPSVTVDGSAFTIAVKKGMAYRTLHADGTTSNWTTVSSNTNLLLKNIAPGVFNATDTSQDAVTLQFRTNATSSNQVSKITTVKIPVQEDAPDADTYGISLNYTSSTTMSLQVKAASTTTPFEYTIVEKDKELNYQKASWTAITSSNAVTLNKTTAPVGCHIYVRKKSRKTSTSDDFTLASKEIDITGTNGNDFPASPVASSLTTLVSTAGVCKTSRSSSYLTFILYSSTQTTVSSISFLDAYGIDKGTVSCRSTVAKNANSTNSNDKYIITTRITSTANIDTAAEQMLYAKITLANSDVITSTSTAGVLLYLYPASKVNNPEDDDTKEFTTKFERVYLSTEKSDDATFKFRLDLGTEYVPNTSAADTFTSTVTAISSLKLDGYTLSSSNGDYSVEYGSYTNEDNKKVATATVTVNVNKFEQSSLIDITDTAIPLEITLNNGEILDEHIYITLMNTATLLNTPIAWSITEGSLKEKKTSTVKNSDGTTTTVEEEVITYTLELSIFKNTYAVSVADVTWGGVSIFGSANITGGKATIHLSNPKINMLTTDSTTTNNIVITLSNGFSIKTGCKLTLLNAVN
jgi:hypothetical protein